MKRLAAALALIATPALADPPANIDARIEALRAGSETPGMAVAIVEDGKVVLAKGYGVRRLGAPAKVDADTIFMIGSTGKAFTTAALGRAGPKHSPQPVSPVSVTISTRQDLRTVVRSTDHPKGCFSGASRTWVRSSAIFMVASFGRLNRRGSGRRSRRRRW